MNSSVINIKSYRNCQTSSLISRKSANLNGNTTVILLKFSISLNPRHHKEVKMDCLFCKIIKDEIPAKIQYQDDLVIAFEDIHPQAPIHTLIIPRLHIHNLNELTAESLPLVGHMVHTASKLAKEFKIAESGYRVIMNCNSDGGQSVFHIHLHLLGGRLMSWPPG
jgi:histidine triad (HIT) family protein